MGTYEDDLNGNEETLEDITLEDIDSLDQSKASSKLFGLLGFFDPLTNSISDFFSNKKKNTYNFFLSTDKGTRILEYFQRRKDSSVNYFKESELEIFLDSIISNFDKDTSEGIRYGFWKKPFFEEDGSFKEGEMVIRFIAPSEKENTYMDFQGYELRKTFEKEEDYMDSELIDFALNNIMNLTNKILKIDYSLGVISEYNINNFVLESLLFSRKGTNINFDLTKNLNSIKNYSNIFTKEYIEKVPISNIVVEKN